MKKKLRKNWKRLYELNMIEVAQPSLELWKTSDKDVAAFSKSSTFLFLLIVYLQINNKRIIFCSFFLLFFFAAFVLDLVFVLRYVFNVE